MGRVGVSWGELGWVCLPLAVSCRNPMRIFRKESAGVGASLCAVNDKRIIRGEAARMKKSGCGSKTLSLTLL